MVKEQNSDLKFRLPKELKNEFERLAETQGVASSAMLRGLMISAVHAWLEAGEGKMRFAVGAETNTNTKGKPSTVFEVPIGRWS